MISDTKVATSEWAHTVLSKSPGEPNRQDRRTETTGWGTFERSGREGRRRGEGKEREGSGREEEERKFEGGKEEEDAAEKGGRRQRGRHREERREGLGKRKEKGEGGSGTHRRDEQKWRESEEGDYNPIKIDRSGAFPVPPVQQLRAIRRFRLRYPTTSWALAEAHITEKCRKQKSEKQRQEQRTAARKAARDARTAGSNIAVVASRSTGAGSDASVSAPVTPAESVATNAIVDSVVTPQRCIAHGPLLPDDTTALASASSTPVPTPAVSTALDAATPEALVLTDFAAQLYHIGVGDEENPDWYLNAAPEVEQPLFLPFNEDDEDMSNDWSEVSAYGAYTNDFYGSPSEDVRALTAAEPISERVEDIHAQDQTASNPIGLSLIGMDVASRSFCWVLQCTTLCLSVFVAVCEKSHCFRFPFPPSPAAQMLPDDDSYVGWDFEEKTTVMEDEWEPGSLCRSWRVEVEVVPG
ncbi:hypothetical protein BZA77DRAFT_352491 [Pyronema omphalodes]|nr:hypothetical protein BZA77DRAFT_352491 [Pyronema omphalodes]